MNFTVRGQLGGGHELKIQGIFNLISNHNSGTLIYGGTKPTTPNQQEEKDSG